MKILMSKKGLSPLIAAVLLIVVVVGIGAVVTGIVRNYVTENKQIITEKASDMKCGVEVGINIPTVLDEVRLCKASDSIKFTMENTGSTTIDDLQVKFFGTGGFGSNDTVGTMTTLFGADGMNAGETIEFNVSFSSAALGQDIVNIQQIKIVPRVKVVGRSEKAYCTDAGLSYSDMIDC
ncbi:MAG: hypothetical protein V1729_03355 [Candidatus Woesearchaeota archaeon]